MQRDHSLEEAILAAFHLACDRGALDTARGLLDLVEAGLERREAPAGAASRARLVAAHERLWLRRQAAGHRRPAND